MDVRIDPELAILYGGKIVEFASSYNKEIANIYSIVDYIKKEWTWKAAQRFTDDIDSYRNEYQEFGKLIANFGELLNSIGKDYQALEEDL